MAELALSGICTHNHQNLNKSFLNNFNTSCFNILKIKDYWKTATELFACMKPIGGYLEFAIDSKVNCFPHSEGILVNTGRNALLLLLQSKNIKSLYVPFYTCPVIFEVLIENGIEVKKYNIDKDFEIEEINNFINEPILYTNYFGIKDNYIFKIAKKLNFLIIDNSQSLFSPLVKKTDCFFSPRKFVGLPDGGILMTNYFVDTTGLLIDDSSDRMGHLLKRTQGKIEEGYKDFQSNEEKIRYQPIKLMSPISRLIINSIDFENIKEKRIKNFIFLSDNLRSLNLLNIDINEKSVPLAYPLLVKNGGRLRAHLIKNKIFCAKYWPHLENQKGIRDVELNLINNLVAIPIDQRYNEVDMKIILNVITNYYESRDV